MFIFIISCRIIHNNNVVTCLTILFDFNTILIAKIGPYIQTEFEHLHNIVEIFNHDQLYSLQNGDVYKCQRKLQYMSEIRTLGNPDFSCFFT